MKILFQGDSITDARRIYDNEVSIGVGYPLLIKSELGFAEPEKYEFVNKGINGSRVVDLYARIKSDIINLEPDVLSILIGVNDVWHNLWEKPNGVDADKYYKVYGLLVEEIMEALPEVKIIILEPFVLKEWATAEKWDIFRPEVEKRAEMARRVASEHHLPFVPLQAGFDELTKRAPAGCWLSDGVHPTTMGHTFIKNEWLKVFRTL